MATLLDMVNGLFRRLREEKVGPLDTTDVLHDVAIELVNDAAKDILESGEAWPFDIRNDGVMEFAAVREGTSGATLTLNVTITSFAPSPDFGWYGRLRLQFPNDTIAPNHSAIIQDYDYSILATTLTINLSRSWTHTAPSNAAWKIWSNESVLPATVRRVLSIRNQETPIRLIEVEKHFDFDRSVPRPADTFSEVPLVAYVGGTMTATRDLATTVGYLDPTDPRNDNPPLTSMGVAVWPIPNVAMRLDYDYVYRHPRLTAATDTLANVPDAVTDLIVWRATQLAYESEIGNDPIKAARIANQIVEPRLQRLHRTMRILPNLRHVPTPFGSRRSLRTYRGRWASQEIAP